MFPLAHTKVALDLFKGHNLKQSERDMLILGSILPDVAEIGIGDEIRTHTEGMQFLKYLGEENRWLGVGVVLHGEKPRGLDYYTHKGFYKLGDRYLNVRSDGGFIARRYSEMLPIIRQYRKSLGRMREDVALHTVTEFCFDYIVAEDDPGVNNEIYRAVKGSSFRPALINFANYFDIDRKHLRMLKRVVHSKHVPRFLDNMHSVEGIAHNFQNFIFLKIVRDKKYQKQHGFLQHLGHIARGSLGFLRRKMRDKSMVQMFEQCVEVVKKDHKKFLSSTEGEMRKMMAANRLLK